jgi:hypothetical protein
VSLLTRFYLSRSPSKEQHHAGSTRQPASSPSAVAELKGAIAQYEELRNATHTDTAAIISASSRLLAIIVAKQVISGLNPGCIPISWTYFGSYEAREARPFRRHQLLM